MFANEKTSVDEHETANCTWAVVRTETWDGLLDGRTDADRLIFPWTPPPSTSMLVWLLCDPRDLMDRICLCHWGRESCCCQWQFSRAPDQCEWDNNEHINFHLNGGFVPRLRTKNSKRAEKLKGCCMLSKNLPTSVVLNFNMWTGGGDR